MPADPTHSLPPVAPPEDILATFHITPNTKPRQTQRDVWKKRPVVIKYRAFADELRRQAAEQGYALRDTLHVEFFMPIAVSLSKKKAAELDGTPHLQTPDVDNLSKAIMDSLLGQDKGVYFLTARKLEKAPRRTPDPTIIKNIWEKLEM